MIDFKLGQEYTFTVVSSYKPPKKVRKRMTTKSPILHRVKDEDGRVFKMYHRGKMHNGRVIKCMVNGFNPDQTPQLVLSLSEQPQSSRPRPDATVSSAHLIYIPMGNKR